MQFGHWVPLLVHTKAWKPFSPSETAGICENGGLCYSENSEGLRPEPWGSCRWETLSSVLWGVTKDTRAGFFFCYFSSTENDFLDLICCCCLVTYLPYKTDKGATPTVQELDQKWQFSSETEKIIANLKILMKCLLASHIRTFIYSFILPCAFFLD